MMRSDSAADRECRLRKRLGASAQIYLAGDNAFAGSRIGIDCGQTHAIASDFLDCHSSASITIDFLGPTDGELDGIARALAVQASDARACANVGAAIGCPIRPDLCTNGSRKAHETSTSAFQRKRGVGRARG